MIILSYKQEGDYVRVVTDNPGRPEFVYPVGRFSSIEALTFEIEKSIALEFLRKEKRNSKFAVLSSELKSVGVVDAAEVVVDEVVN